MLYLIDKYKDNAESIYPTALQLFSICDDKDGFVKLLLSNSYSLSLEKRIEIVEYLIGKYKNDTKSLYYITTQLFDICEDTTSIKNIKANTKYFYKYIKYYHSWDGLPSYWCIKFNGLPGYDTGALTIGNSASSENDYDNI